jgi:hypothetical protein
MNIDLGNHDLTSVLSGEKPLQVHVTLGVANIAALAAGIFIMAVLWVVLAKKVIK